MNDTIEHLIYKFEDIKSLGWIKSLRNDSTGVGYTFETLIGKHEENFEIPDYNGIEIKTKRFFSNKYITLFNANPDGRFLFEIERILEKYGYPDKKYNNSKIFQISLYSKFEKSINKGKYNFKIKVNRNDKKINLLVFDNNKNLIDNETYWSFDLLDEKLNRKLNMLAIVFANSKYVNNEEYLKYQKINIYKLNSFEYFLKAIELGYIRISFKIGIFKNGKRKGQIHNHGVGFDLCTENLLYLYKRLI